MTQNETPTNETPLESWKEIAAYLKRDVRTVKRWEKSEALPVRRHLHQARSTVYAYASELNAWWATRQPRLEAPAASFWRPAPILATTAVLLLTLLSVASGPILTPAGAADASAGKMVARQVWAGPEVDAMGAPSPDGRYLTYVDWSTGDLAVRDLTTGNNRRLTNKGSWTGSDEYAEFSIISPDGQHIAYAWFNEKFYELRLIGLDGSNPRVLYSNADLTYVQPAGWSPDGKQILAVFARADRTNQIAFVSVADGSMRVLKTLDWRYPHARLSPDGNYIAYDFPPKEDSGERDLFLLASDASWEMPLVSHPAHDYLLGWAPDGKQLLFASNRTGGISIWSLPLQDGRPKGAPAIVRLDVGPISPIGFAGDGSFYYGMGEMKDVYVAEFDAARVKFLSPPQNATERFVGTNRGPDWSPDGRFLAYVSRRGPPQKGISSKVIVIRSLETGEEQELALKMNLPNSPRAVPRWSPDGRFLLLAGRDLKGRGGFYRLEVASGALTPLVQSNAPDELAAWMGAAWAADGRAIFFQRWAAPAKQASLVVRELDTGQEKVLYRSHHLHAWALTPDGRQLAFATQDEKTGDRLRSDVLKVMSASGGPARELLRVPGKEEITALVWTPDGRHLLFSRGSDVADPDAHPAYQNQVWRMAISGGTPELLELSLKPVELDGLRFQPVGNRVAFTVAHEASNEIWVLENFLPALKAAK